MANTEDPAKRILGNVPDSLKREIGTEPFKTWSDRNKALRTFAGSVMDRIRVDEIWLTPDPEEKERWVAKVVCGMRIEEGERPGFFSQTLSIVVQIW